MIRRLQLNDLDAIMEIEPEAYGTHHWSRQSFIGELTNSCGYYYGAECMETGRLLGYTGYWLMVDEAHVTTLAVHPEARRRRVAERLLLNSFVEAKAEGALRLTLEVRVSNTAARDLYSKYGFKRLGVRKRYYQDNKEDALVLWTDRLTDEELASLVDERMDALDMRPLVSARMLGSEVIDLATA